MAGVLQEPMWWRAPALANNFILRYLGTSSLQGFPWESILGNLDLSGGSHGLDDGPKGLPGVALGGLGQFKSWESVLSVFSIPQLYLPEHWPVSDLSEKKRAKIMMILTKSLGTYICSYVQVKI